MQAPHMPRINWQPLVDAAAFALKAGVLILVVTLPMASNPDWTEIRSAILGGVLAGGVKHGSRKLPESMKKFGV